MLRFKRSSLLLSAVILVSTSALAQKIPLIRGEIDDSKVVVLSGNTRAEATAANDAGPQDPTTVLSTMRMVLKRSDTAQAEFERYLEALSRPASPYYHQWLSSAQVGAMFGPAPEDIARLTDWLTAKGFAVYPVSPDGMVLTFDGTVDQVQKTFHTSIHQLNVNGVMHMANMTDPDVPAAFSPLVGGIASLSDFMPHTMHKNKVQPARTNIVGGNGYNLVGAADLATIYNFNPLFKAGITGRGQTIVVVEDTDQYSLGDFLAFRKAFGLTRPYPYGNLLQTHPAPPTGPNNCTDPGVNGDDGEAAIDVEWASAAAPNATIVNASCSSRGTSFGGFTALQNLLNGPLASVPNVVSVSYGESEPLEGATMNLYINNLYSLGAAEGVSIFVSSGDEGAASSDPNAVSATHGIAVSGWTSTPYNVSVGGTDYAASYLGTTANYWSQTNGPNYLTAMSYIPEIPWNDSCGSQLLAIANGFASSAGAAGFCNSSIALTNDAYLTTASGSGGPSGCATGTAAVRGVVGGTCKGYAKPSWQSVFGNPSDGVRDIPDVSLMAANGVWGSYYAVCYSDPDTSRTGGDAGSCLGDPSTWAGFGGTSISSPIWAGIQALVNQSTAQNWGNPNPVLYSIANIEYGASGSSACNSTATGGPNANCVFYDVTLGDMDVNCSTGTKTVGTNNCYQAGSKYGVLSLSNTVDQPAYGTTAGWDFATGIGTTNATNLVKAFNAVAAAAASKP